MTPDSNFIVIREVAAVAGRVMVQVATHEAKVRVELGVTQDPRFFERFLKGRPAVEVPYVMSRICGVCSIAHLTCSINAIEKAVNVEPKPEVLKLREIAKGLEVVQNNLVHILMSIPDFTGCSSTLEFVKKYPDIFNKLVEANKMVLEVYKKVYGRFIHTPSMGVGIHGKIVHKYTLENAGRTLQKLATHLYELTQDLAEIWHPVAPGYEDPAPTYCVLNYTKSYPLFSEELLFSDGQVVPASSYGNAIEEILKPYSNSKFALYKGRAFYTGSRARLQAYKKLLTSEAKEMVEVMKINFRNPFDNVKAQYVEAAWLAAILSDVALDLASRIHHGLAPYETIHTSASGEGVALATAPRGTLIHHYTIKEGRLEKANIVTPTVMNAEHMEVAGEALVKWMLNRGETDEAAIRNAVSALVRSYDPCFPCSVH